jgi:hypothetical protein
MNSIPAVGPAGWDDPAAAEVLDALAVQCRSVDRAEADKLAMVVHYVDRHPVTDSHRAACWDLNHGVENPDTRAGPDVWFQHTTGTGSVGVSALTATLDTPTPWTRRPSSTTWPPPWAGSGTPTPSGCAAPAPSRAWRTRNAPSTRTATPDPTPPSTVPAADPRTRGRATPAWTRR